MARSHPKDRFHSVPESLLRVGAHRALPRRRSGWIVFAWAALATGILVAIGVAGLFAVNHRIQFIEAVIPNSSKPSSPPATPSAPAAPSPAAAVVDKTASITVLNGSSKSGLAAATVKRVVAAGWNSDSVAANASSLDVKTTTVYYSDSAREGAARGLAQTLGGVTVAQSSEFASYNTHLVVVLGADFAAR